MSNVEFSGKIIQVITEKHGDKIFEKAQRSPGVRALIIKDDKILISREFRDEINNYDYRLPGGKVFDTLEEFCNHQNENLIKHAQKAVVKECFEEVGLKVSQPKLIKISKAGATITWDLYYFEIKKFKEDVQHLEDGEDISFAWYSIGDILTICNENKMSEDRSVGVLLNYILKHYPEQVRTFLDDNRHKST